MTEVNIKRLVDNISKINIYTPIVEAIVNSMHSIEESGKDDGEIIVTIKRNRQASLELSEDSLPFVCGVEITDNGIGFNEGNRSSFNKVYSDKKIAIGGKGFGRFAFLKCFDDVKVESIYGEKDKYFKREFDFIIDDDIIRNEKIQETENKRTKTTLMLEKIKGEYQYRLEKRLETIARKLLEKLLVYFVIDDFKCPKITIQEEGGHGAIVLNDYFLKNRDITKIEDKEFTLTTDDQKKKEKFKIKVFKIFYGDSRSSIDLVAHNRQVTEEALYSYVPEFKDDFYDNTTNEDGQKIQKNYKIKTYVLGKYLDDNVSLERSEFEFHNNKDLLYPFSQQEIEKEAAKITKEVFRGEVLTRQEKKNKRIREYVDCNAPWQKSYLADLDLSSLSFDINDSEIESELEKIRFQREQTARSQIAKMLLAENGELLEKVDGIIGQITEIGKNELAHYVALRKAVLDLLKKGLSWNDEKKYEKEKVVHDIFFPTSSDSDTTPYEKHNLWIIDERLSFHEYLASDRPLNGNDKRPDIVIFDRKISVRGGNDLSNPIVVFEFKRPERENYDENDDPIKQIGNYVEQIRQKKFKNPDGRTIVANDNTPAYGFLICDLSPKIKEFCRDHSLTESPDQKGYFGFHSGYKLYIEVMSFDKLVDDAELRNKIFFKKLGIE